VQGVGLGWRALRFLFAEIGISTSLCLSRDDDRFDIEMSLKKGVLSHLGGLLNEAFDYDTYFAKLGTTRACLFFANLPLGDMNHNRLPRQAQDEHKHKFRPHKTESMFARRFAESHADGDIFRQLRRARQVRKTVLFVRFDI
jgi:hypothetical protein